MRVSENLRNSLQDRLDIFQLLIVPKAQYPIAPLSQKGGPPPIRVRLNGMLSSVELHYHPAFRATEVRNVAADRMLATELGTVYLSSTQPRPQLALGVGLLTPESPGMDPER